MAPIMRYLFTVMSLLSLWSVPTAAFPLLGNITSTPMTNSTLSTFAKEQKPKQYHPLELDAKLMAGMQCAATPSKCAQRSDDKCKNEWFWETDKDQALTSAKAFCKALNPKNEGKKSVVETVSRIVDGDRVVKDYTNGMGVWDIKVEDVEGCLTEEQHGERRYMSQPTVKYSCVDVLYDLWRQCDNKGRGGSVEIGCLKYTMIPAKPTAGDIKDWHNSGWHSWRFAL